MTVSWRRSRPDGWLSRCGGQTFGRTGKRELYYLGKRPRTAPQGGGDSVMGGRHAGVLREVRW